MSDSTKSGDSGKPFIPRPNPVAGPRRVLVQRNPLPTVNRMLEDAYHILGTQLTRFRDKSQSQTFDVKDATAFNKLINSLTTLQDTERKNTALLELSRLTQPELEALSQQSTEILKSGT